MSFVLPVSLAAALRDVALQEIDATLERLRGTDLTDDDVHRARKACKRLRGWAVLLREPLKDEANRIEHWLRLTGRGLTEAREAAVRLQTADALGRRHPEGAAALDAVREHCRAAAAASAPRAGPQSELLAEPEPESEPEPGPASEPLLGPPFERDADASSAGTQVIGSLRRARDAVAAVVLPTIDPAMLERGLRAGYRRARKAMRRANADDSDAMHEWRKKLRRHTDQCKLLSELYPELAGARQRQLQKLNDALGTHHDLADFEHALAHIERLTPGQRQQLQALMAHDQKRLARKALRRGERLFADKPAQWRLACAQRGDAAALTPHSAAPPMVGSQSALRSNIRKGVS